MNRQQRRALARQQNKPAHQQPPPARGELKINLGTNDRGAVVVSFGGKSVDNFGLEPEGAIAFGEAIISLANELLKQKVNDIAALANAAALRVGPRAGPPPRTPPEAAAEQQAKPPPSPPRLPPAEVKEPTA